MIYQPPTVDELKAIFLALGRITGDGRSTNGGLSGAQVAELICASDSRTVRRWLSSAEDVAVVGYPVLYTVCHRGGGREIEPWNWREQIADWLDAGAESQH